MRRRRNIRKPVHDYTDQGHYFITIASQDRMSLFGKIVSDVMVLNDAGEMIQIWYKKIFEKFPHARCHGYVVMPNHFHCIIQIFKRPLHEDYQMESKNPKCDFRPLSHVSTYDKDGIVGIMDWFKTMTTNAYIRGVKENQWPRFNRRLWQKRFWDYIIQDELRYYKICDYIERNPELWEQDSLRK